MGGILILLGVGLLALIVIPVIYFIGKTVFDIIADILGVFTTDGLKAIGAILFIVVGGFVLIIAGIVVAASNNH